MNNPILDADSYKFSHFNQYPPDTKGTFFYLESRGGIYDETVFFGLNYIIHRYLNQPITMEMVEEAKTIIEAHGEPFDYIGWKYIAGWHKGYLPLHIRAVQEGSIVPTHNVLMTVESTDPHVFWLPGWIETQLVRLWYPITVATISYHCKKLLRKYWLETSDSDPMGVSYQLHDFGARGVSSQESAGIGGLAHLVNFRGSDTVQAIVFAQKYYNEDVAALSIPAMEHSTVTAWGRESEHLAYENMLSRYSKPNRAFACVVDSYNDLEAITEIGAMLGKKLLLTGGTLVIRLDSGDPIEVIHKVLPLLHEYFTSFTNSKGFQVFTNIKILWGDGLDPQTIETILAHFCGLSCYSSENFVFGMGGGLLQKVHRDTFKFAYKLSAIQNKDGVWRGVNKSPVNDPSKKSRAGRLDLICNDRQYETVESDIGNQSALHTVYYSSISNRTVTTENLSCIRERIDSSL